MMRGLGPEQGFLRGSSKGPSPGPALPQDKERLECQREGRGEWGSGIWQLGGCCLLLLPRGANSKTAL